MFSCHNCGELKIIKPQTSKTSIKSRIGSQNSYIHTKYKGYEREWELTLCSYGLLYHKQIIIQYFIKIKSNEMYRRTTLWYIWINYERSRAVIRSKKKCGKERKNELGSGNPNIQYHIVYEHKTRNRRKKTTKQEWLLSFHSNLYSNFKYKHTVPYCLDISVSVCLNGSMILSPLTLICSSFYFVWNVNGLHVRYRVCMWFSFDSLYCNHCAKEIKRGKNPICQKQRPKKKKQIKSKNNYISVNQTRLLTFFLQKKKTATVVNISFHNIRQSLKISMSITTKTRFRYEEKKPHVNKNVHWCLFWFWSDNDSEIGAPHKNFSHNNNKRTAPVQSYLGSNDNSWMSQINNNKNREREW